MRTSCCGSSASCCSLACVGLKAGERFFEQLVYGPGLAWMGYGVFITLVPLLIVGFVGRLVLKTNFMNCAVCWPAA